MKAIPEEPYHDYAVWLKEKMPSGSSIGFDPLLFPGSNDLSLRFREDQKY